MRFFVLIVFGQDTDKSCRNENCFLYDRYAHIENHMGGDDSLYALEPTWLPEGDLTDSRVNEKAHRT